MPNKKCKCENSCSCHHPADCECNNQCFLDGCPCECHQNKECYCNDDRASGSFTNGHFENCPCHQSKPQCECSCHRKIWYDGQQCPTNCCGQNKPQKVAERIPFVTDNGSYHKEKDLQYSKEEVADWDWKKEYSELVKYIFYTKDPNYGAENLRNKNTIEIFITKTIAQEYEKGLEDGRNIEKRLNEKWKEELIEWLDTALFSTSNVLGGTKYQLEHLQAHIRDIINKIKNND